MSRRRAYSRRAAVGALSGGSPARAPDEPAEPPPDDGAWRVAPGPRPGNKRRKGKQRKTAQISAERGLATVSIRLYEIVKAERLVEKDKVADRLTQEFTQEQPRGAAEALPEDHKDLKNIRRRIYDAINILTSANVIQRVGEGLTQLRWRDPTDPEMQLSDLHAERNQWEQRLAEKRELLRVVQEKRGSFESLLKRNRDPDFARSCEKRRRIALPFIAIDMECSTTIKMFGGEQAGAAAAAATAAAAAAPAAPAPAAATPAAPAAETAAAAPAAAETAAAAKPKKRNKSEVVEFEFSSRFNVQDDAAILHRMDRGGAFADADN